MKQFTNDRYSRFSSQVTDEPFTIRSSNPEIPTIVITPCPTQERDRSCWVPYQDASFGNRLSVPMHPAVNNVFPPLVAKPAPFVEHWRFIDGHWRALLPSLEEQMQKGMFSRPRIVEASDRLLRCQVQWPWNIFDLLRSRGLSK